MNQLVPTLAIALGLAAIGCGGPQQPAKSSRPTAVLKNSDRDTEEGAQEHSAKDKSAEESSTESPAPATASTPSEHRSVAPADDNPQSPEGTADAEDAPRTPPKPTKHSKSESTCQKSSAGLALMVDRKTVSIEEGRLRAKMDGPLCSIVMRIMLKDGAPTVEKDFEYTGSDAELRWDPIPRDRIEKIELRITAKDHAYQAVTLTPWSVSIDHKEVEFDTNKAVIRDSEQASLNDSLAKIKEVLARVEDKGLGTITLFIAGHTDTQGSNEHNLTLSQNRAQAIASWFIKRGLCIPVAFEGFGETALKKLTADNVDEQANRRADYILAVEPPTIRKGATPAWKWISKGC